MTAGGGSKDFFVSYSGADRAWAEWIAWVLEEAGYTVVLQALSQTAKRLHSLNPKLATRFLDVALEEASFSDAIQPSPRDGLFQRPPFPNFLQLNS